MPYRLIQWGTGNVGKHALRAIVDRPDFELVGLRVYNPDKVGKDAGELLGSDPVGVTATDSTDAIVALDADCVCYAPLGSTLEDPDEPLDDICRLLASGKDVVSCAVEYHAYLEPGVEIPRAGTNAHERIHRACQEGGTSFFHAGINPGFTMEAWPLLLTQTCRRIDQMTVTEVVDMARNPSSHMLEYLGFGTTAEDAPMDRRLSGKGLRASPFYMGMVALTRQLGMELEDVRYHRDVALTEEPLEVAAGTIPAGTVAVIRFGFEGIVHGRPTVVYRFVWRLTDDLEPSWPTGDSRWIVHVDGDPTLDSEIRLATDHDAGRAVSLAVATVLLNAVPAVRAAPPGLYNNMSIGLHGGGYVLP